MKNHLKLLIAVAVLATSCNKNDDDVLNDTEVVEMIEATLAAADEGLAKEVESAARLANEAVSGSLSVCDIDFDSTYNLNYQGLVREVNFDYEYDWKVGCRNDEPTSMDFTAKRNGSYYGPRLEYNGNGTNKFKIKDLNSGSEYTLDGSIEFSANTSRMRVLTNETADANIEIEADLKKLKVNKTNLKITSGKAKFKMSATSILGSADYSIQVEFGDGTAEINFNGNVTEVTL